MNYHILKRKLGLDKIDIFKILKSEKTPFFFLLAIMLYTYSFQKMDLGDDLWFQQVTKSYSLVNYLQLRYMSWTGRMSAEGVLYFIFRDNGFILKLLNPLVIVILVCSISRIVIGKQKNSKNYLINWYICISWLFINKQVIDGAILWMTGSIVYLWTMVAALIAFIPFRDKFVEENNGKIKILYLICALFASMGEEQVSLVLLVFMIVMNIIIFIKQKKVYKYLILENIIVLIGVLILFIAPGNYVRKYEETINWLPNYPYYSKIEIVFYGIQWLLNNLLNDNRIVFFLVLLVLSVALYKNNKGLQNKLAMIIPILGCCIIIATVIFSLDILLPVQIVKEIKFPSIYHSIGEHLNRIFINFNLPVLFSLRKYTTLKYFLWPIIIVSAVYIILYLYDFSAEGICIALIYVAGICSAMIMFVSPTIYASGARTFFVLAVMFLIVFIFILKKSKVLLKKRYVAILAIFAALKYVYIFLLN